MAPSRSYRGQPAQTCSSSAACRGLLRDRVGSHSFGESGSDGSGLWDAETSEGCAVTPPWSLSLPLLLGPPFSPAPLLVRACPRSLLAAKPPPGRGEGAGRFCLRFLETRVKTFTQTKLELTLPGAARGVLDPLPADPTPDTCWASQSLRRRCSLLPDVPRPAWPWILSLLPASSRSPVPLWWARGAFGARWALCSPLRWFPRGMRVAVYLTVP